MACAESVTVTNPRLLVFGGRGAIGSAVIKRFTALHWNVTATSRFSVTNSPGETTNWITCDPSIGTPSALFDLGSPYAAVCWAQGRNTADSIYNVDLSLHLEIYRANCLFTLETLGLLLRRDLLGQPARLVVVSSIWQRIARQDRLSYTMSKAALGGLVLSTSIDLAARGILINAVLPSAIDTPMTREGMTRSQIDHMAESTGFSRLTTLDDVVSAIEFLCSDGNTGITGQSLTVDLGYSHARIV